MTFFIGLDFDPDWMKSVARHPSLEKINESKFNLESMSKYRPAHKEFQYALSNFLNSSRSIIWFLLEEYNRKFGFNIGKYFTDQKYREKRKKSLSLEAEKFLHWYEKRFEDLKKDYLFFLI